MKKLIIALVLGACGSAAMAATTDVCAPGSPPFNVIGAVDGSKFIRVTFAPTCSTNTVMVGDDDGTKYWGTSGSVKGQSIFGASTNGGSAGNMGPCNAGKACGTTAATKTAITGKMTDAAALGNTN
jgi:hypothetical protein